MQVNELSRARRTLALSREGVARVAFIGSAGYENQASLVSDRSFSPNPQTIPGEPINVKHYAIPLDGTMSAIRGYNGIRVGETAAHTTTDSRTAPLHPVYDIVTFFIGGDQRPRPGSVSIKSTGDATYYSEVVNEASQGRHHEMDRSEELLDLRKRTARGLVIARLTTAVLEQLHEIPHIPTERLDEAQAQLTRIMPLEELLPEDHFAQLIPQAA